jgi:subtilase family serine protease
MKTFLRKLPFGCALTFVCLFAAGQASGQTTPPAANRITQVPDNSTRITLKGGVHPLARAEFSRGAVAESLAINRILLLLKRSDEQEAALQSLLESQQDISSANYHKWLSPEDFGKQFGPSDADIQSVTDWLTSQGFHDIRVAAGRGVMEFSGNAAQVRQAFLTQIQNYAVNNAMYVANSSDPQIPAALAPVISGIVSLHNFPKRFHSRFLGDVRRDPGSRRLQPLFTFPDPSSGTALYGVGPGDFATIYSSKTLVNGGNDGTGQTIAIVGETQIDPTDVSDFRNMFGLTNNFSSSNIIVNGMDPGITSPDEESESDLDVQWSGAVAPGATVKFVVSASTPASAGIDLSALYIVEHNLADIVSESYGACESDLGTAGNAFYNSLWEQAAAQGITVVVSSGDGGSAGCDDFNNQDVATHGLAVSGLAGTPFNVSVGGTDFNQINRWSTYWNATNDSVTGTSAKSYIPEVPWSDNCAQLGLTGCGSTAPDWSHNIVAGSGGPSKVYGKPKWQMGVNGVPNDNHRDQPDISLFASPGFTGSFYLFCQKDLTYIQTCSLNSPFYTFHAIGGTSASAPAFGGVMALVNQYSAAHAGSSRQGNPNPVLYALAKKSGASCASSASEAAGCIFNDVTSGNTYLATHYGKSVGTNSVPCEGGTPNCSSSVPSANGVLVDPSHTTTEAWTAAAGYDMATGLGSLNINSLATNWGSVSTIGTTTTLSLSPTTGITHGTNENVSVTVNVAPKTGTGVPSGDVSLIATLADGSTLGLDQFTLTNGSIGGMKTQSLPGGTYKVYAHYAGDGTNAPSDSIPVQVTVGKESSQTFIVIPSFDSQGNQYSGNTNSVTYGSDYIIRMYVANASATASPSGPPSPTCENVNEVTCPTGTVALTANGSAVDGGAYALNNNGYTRDIAPTLTGGSYSLVAKYSGDNSYTASTSATDTFTVTPAPSSTFLWGPVTTQVGASTAMYAQTTVSVPNGVAPTGSFSVTDNGSPFTGTVSTQSAGAGLLQGNITATFSTVGAHTVVATYSGDASYSVSPSNSVTIYAQYPVAVSISADSTNINYGQAVKITATATTSHSTPKLTGNLSFYYPFAGTQGPVTTALTADGSGNQIMTATFSVTPNGNGYISALYQNDYNYQNSSSATLFINVNIPDFTLGPASGLSLIAMAGQPASAQITVSPLSQTPSTVNLSWYGMTANAIAGYTLSLSPQQVGLNGTTSIATLSLTPTGSGPQSTIRRSLRHSGFHLLPSGDWRSFGLLIGLAAVFLLARPNRHKRYRLAIGFGAASLVSVAIGCGGGSTGTSGGGGGGGSSPTATSITLTTSNAKVDQNTPFILTATVAGQHPLTGTVSIYDYGTGRLGPITLTNGQAQITAKQVASSEWGFTSLPRCTTAIRKIRHRHLLPSRKRSLEYLTSKFRVIPVPKATF